MLPNQTSSRVQRSASAVSSRLAQLYVVLSGGVAMLYSVLMVRNQAPWPLGDWLINYRGGFVRRGLPGELILLASRALRIPLLWTAGAMQMFCILAFTAGIWWLVRQLFLRATTFWEKAFLLSPATLAFLWFDPEFILRKEILLFALLNTVAVWLLRRAETREGSLCLFLSLACPALLLAHEGLVCYLPYLFAVVALWRRSVAGALKICVLPALLSLVPLALSVRYTGTPEVSARVCQSIGGPQSGLCYGPIFYLGIPRGAYEGEVQALLKDNAFLWAFGATAALAAIPIFLGLWDTFQRPVARSTRWVIPAAFLISAFASLVLFMEAQDWSRWLYIHTMCLLTVLFFAVLQRRTTEHATATQDDRPRVPRLVQVSALVLYATLWHLPGLHEHSPYGYISVFKRAAQHAPETKFIRSLDHLSY